MDRRGYLRATGLVGVAGVATAIGAQAGGGGQDAYDTIRVPDDQATVQDGVDAAEEGDLVLVAPGTYAESVEVTTPGITLRGIDRNEVVLDGAFEPGHGVAIDADGVAVENLTVRHFQDNAVYWSGVEGFRGSFITAYNNGYYGLYAYSSTDGRFEYSYASGHPDAGFYFGWNQPFDALITDVVAEYNSLGYSGTNTGEGITIRDSIWRHNGAGIAPNTLSNEDPTQRASEIVGNVVYDNGYADGPTLEYPAWMFGTGIVVWSGHDNHISDNVVDGHPNYGIAVHSPFGDASGNVVRENVVSESGRADLALGASAGEGNTFEANQFATSAPAGLQGDAGSGSEDVTAVYEELMGNAEETVETAGDWRDQPVPGNQPTMRDPEVAPRAADRETSVVGENQ